LAKGKSHFSLTHHAINVAAIHFRLFPPIFQKPTISSRFLDRSTFLQNGYEILWLTAYIGVFWIMPMDFNAAVTGLGEMRLLGELPPFGRIVAFWANCHLLGESSPSGQIVTFWAIFNFGQY
jgi:hypothetical protein